MAEDGLSIEVFRNLTTIGGAALRFATWCNGGALVAAVTLVDNPGTVASGDIAAAARWFVMGVFLGGIAHLFAYLLNLAHFRELQGLVARQSHVPLLWVTFALVAAAIICFLIGGVTLTG